MSQPGVGHGLCAWTPLLWQWLLQEQGSHSRPDLWASVRLPLHVVLMRIRYSRLLLHTSLWEHPPSHSLSLDQPTCPRTRSGCPCGHATSLLRCHVLLPCQEVWVQVSQAVTAAHLLPGESPCPSICQYGCVWSPAWSSTRAPMGLKRATPKVWLDFFLGVAEFGQHAIYKDLFSPWPNC